MKMYIQPQRIYKNSDICSLILLKNDRYHFFLIRIDYIFLINQDKEFILNQFRENMCLKTLSQTLTAQILKSYRTRH